MTSTFRTSGTCPASDDRPAAPHPRCPGERGALVCFFVLRISARGRADTSPRKDLAVSRGRRTPRVPRGALSRCITTRRSSHDPQVVARSANLVRRRLPPSDELSRPARGQATTAGATKGGPPHPRWSRGDSNPGPPPCKGGALPAKLRPRHASPGPPGGRAWTRTRDLGLIRAAL
jgi:hypothetical protein